MNAQSILKICKDDCRHRLHYDRGAKGKTGVMPAGNPGFGYAGRGLEGDSEKERLSIC